MWRDLIHTTKAKTAEKLADNIAVKKETTSLQRLAQWSEQARHAIECPWRSQRLACDWCDLRRRYISKPALCCRCLLERNVIRAMNAVANCSGPTRDLPASRQTQTSADCLQVDHARSSLGSQELNRTTGSLA